MTRILKPTVSTLNGTIAVSALISALVCAQPAKVTPPPFEEVDVDHDNILDIDEARQAFGDLVLEDLDGDGMLNKREAEQALPGLADTRDTHEDARQLIGLSDYLQMVDFYLNHRLVPPPSTEEGRNDKGLAR